MKLIPTQRPTGFCLRCPHLMAAPIVLAGAWVLLEAAKAADSSSGPLPDGVQAVWDGGRAEREVTQTRERICVNGLWRWQPAEAKSDQVPGGDWGWFKVPGSWPGITDYMQKDCQTVFAHPNWKNRRLGEIKAAWYQRDIVVPAAWSGRRVTLEVGTLNSFASVFIDGGMVGELRFPGGELDLTAHCRPGNKHGLSILLVAMPLEGVMLSYSDSASAREEQGFVARRGLCGDVFLTSTPSGPRIVKVRLDTSVRRRELTCEAAMEGLVPDAKYLLRAMVTDDGHALREFTSAPFAGADVVAGRVALTDNWLPDRLWDLHTPQHQYDLQLSLLDAGGEVLDADWTRRFGFREFSIDGRDFYLNGSRLYLSAVPLDNAQVGAAWASYGAARESLERLKSFGINFVYTHNYGCEPGAHLAFDEILRAADDVGMLVSFSQPHFSHYDWKAPDADHNNGYADHAAFYVNAAGNHPAVVMYSMSHNATGYAEDMNPDMIDGIREVRDSWALNNVKLAQRAEAIVRKLDPGRLVYHHASGNLGILHAINFYPNFVPVQELSDWFRHWATTGVKPVFLCEYGAPFTWDWTMYRGWYQGKREFGSAKVPWEFCLAEWNAQFLGDRAFRISEAEKTNLRWEAKQLLAGRVWHRWDYPHQVGSSVFDERYPVFARYLTDNWRAFRTWGVSAISPWEYGHFWKPRPGLEKRRKELAVDWANLQRPGFSPDFVDGRYERMDLAFERADWDATPAAQALLRNNRPLLAYLGGEPGAFTGKDHNFLPGQTVAKQLIVINNSREAVSCACRWSLNLPEALTDEKTIALGTGQQERIPLRFDLPVALAPGRYELTARFAFDTGERQEDHFTLDVLAPPAPSAARPWKEIALFDPPGETRALLEALGVETQAVDAGADLSSFGLVVVGKGALTPDGPAPGLGGVREGQRVIVFEQSAEVLQKRLGFRVAEYGLRQIFPRVPDHPVLAGLTSDHLRDWGGEATLLAPRLEYALDARRGPTVEWNGITVPHLWRCGNRGNVASVLIEKPARGDFLPILDGGYSLQYSPLLEFREGRGMVVFCQMDVTGRTTPDPAAALLVRNLLHHAAEWSPVPRRSAVYVGEAAGKGHLEAAGLPVEEFDAAALSPERVLIVGPGGGERLSGRGNQIGTWLAAGGHLLAVGLDQAEVRKVVPMEVTMKKAEHIASFFEPPAMNSLLAGVGPADVHNRDPRELPLVHSGAKIVGNGVLAEGEHLSVVFCQLAPWRFDRHRQANLARTHRRASALLSRLLGNLGVSGATPLVERMQRPVTAAAPETRWLEGLYLDVPTEWDDPYRFFRW